MHEHDHFKHENDNFMHADEYFTQENLIEENWKH